MPENEKWIPVPVIEIKGFGNLEGKTVRVFNSISGEYQEIGTITRVFSPRIEITDAEGIRQFYTADQVNQSLIEVQI